MEPLRRAANESSHTISKQLVRKAQSALHAMFQFDRFLSFSFIFSSCVLFVSLFACLFFGSFVFNRVTCTGFSFCSTVKSDTRPRYLMVNNFFFFFANNRYSCLKKEEKTCFCRIYL